MKIINANELSKLDLQVLTSKAKVKCLKCRNDIYLFNLKGMSKEVNELLTNKLIYEGLNGKGQLELSYFFECPICHYYEKIFLHFLLNERKETLIFDCEVIHTCSAFKQVSFLEKSKEKDFK